MQDIFNKLESIYKECVALKSDLQSKQSAIAQVVENQKVLDAQLAKKEAGLLEREKALIKVEDLIKYKQDADVRMEQAEQYIKDCALRMKNFTIYEDAQKKELSIREQKVAKLETEVKSKETHLETLILDKVKGILGR